MRLSRLVVLVAVAPMSWWSCGGDTPSPTTPAIAVGSPVPTPTPALAVPSPTPEPSATPCPQDVCEEPTTNNARPVRLTMRLYTVEDGYGNFISNPSLNDPIEAGTAVARIDVTAKDIDNRDTNGEGPVVFEVDDPSLVEIWGNHTHQRRLRGTRAGDLEIWAVQDGVRSNTLTLKFR